MVASAWMRTLSPRKENPQGKKTSREQNDQISRRRIKQKPCVSEIYSHNAQNKTEHNQRDLASLSRRRSTRAPMVSKTDGLQRVDRRGRLEATPVSGSRRCMRRSELWTTFSGASPTTSDNIAPSAAVSGTELAGAACTERAEAEMRCGLRRATVADTASSWCGQRPGKDRWR